MVLYYLDIETYGTGKRPDPKSDRIIAIILCAIDPRSGAPIQEPILLKEWETSEEEIVRQLGKRMLTTHPFDFVPAGFSVLFDLWFLKHKFHEHLGEDLDDTFYLDQPYIDLKQVMVFENDGQFKGVRIGVEGNPVQDWYAFGDHGSIERHMRDKLARFSEEWERLKGLTSE